MDHFVAGFADGSVALYNSNTESPLTTWEIPNGKPVIQITWSTTRQSVFYALTTQAVMVFDLSSNQNVCNCLLYKLNLLLGTVCK